MKPLSIFIGFDPRETVAYHVLSHSILQWASGPVSITPVAKWHMRAFHTRERGPYDSTDFAISRFLVPFLCDYGGLALFMDCDMLVRCDVYELLELAKQDRHRAVYVCQHTYTPKEATKFLGQQQTVYPRKNWSSLMLFRNKYCRVLTPGYINEARGLALHGFEWTRDGQIGALPLEYNWLVGEYEKNPDAKILHYTCGGPWFRDYQCCDHAEEWFEAMQQAYPSLNQPKPDIVRDGYMLTGFTDAHL